ncbi:MAG: glycosyltransferase family 4 protein [Patescibacteria group bacterium]
MNVLILNWKDIRNPDVGGAEIILYELSKRLVRDGHSVTWFCRTCKGAKSQETIDGIRIIRRGNRFTVYWEAYLYYRKLIVKPDKVLDCVNTICWQTPLYVPKEKRIAYVNQLAKEVFFYELPPVLSHIAYFLEPLEYLTYRDTTFLCYSESVKKDITTFGIPEKNISTFPIGIDHDRYKSGKKSKDPLFLFVARLTSMKRPDLCIEAMRIVTRKYPKAKLAIVGYGPMEDALEHMISDYKLGENVMLVNKNHLFFDTNPKDQKVKLMQQAWALLLPSVKEGWGMVVTEAAACGTASIVTDVTGLRDSVKAEQTGIVLGPTPSVADLSAAIIRLITDKARQENMGKNASVFSDRFSWERSYESFLTLISRDTQ